MKKTVFYFLQALMFLQILPAQRPNASTILHEIQKLGVTGSVLYVAAHPDDENTRLIGWLANEKKLETSYISLTRGDGGQNLIGPDLGPMLGLIRSRELISARQIDGGRQYFTRAYDFGFSKSWEETLRLWNKKDLLADLLYVIEKEKPDVIITRFSVIPGGTHGHHTTSAMLALEAFRLLQDTTSAQVHRPSRIFWNTSPFFYRNQGLAMPDTFMKMEISGYNPLLGMSYSELAAKSRSLHRSQGFGTAPNFSDTREYFQWLAGDRPENEDILLGFDFSWRRFDPNTRIPDLLDSIVTHFSPAYPEFSAQALLKLYREILKINVPFYSERKAELCKKLILDCLGIEFQANADKPFWIAGDSVKITLLQLSRGIAFAPDLSFGERLKRRDISSTEGSRMECYVKSLKLEGPLSGNFRYHNGVFTARLSESATISQPFWLREPILNNMFQVKNSEDAVRAWNYPVLQVRMELVVFDEVIEIVVPVQHRSTDPSYGEMVRPVHIYPDFTIQTDVPAIVLAQAGKWQEINIQVTAYAPGKPFRIGGHLPKGWEARLPEETMNAIRSGQQFVLKIPVRVTTEAQPRGEISFHVDAAGKKWTDGLRKVEYEHTGPVLWFEPCRMACTYESLKFPDKKVVYLHGAGDQVAEGLLRVGADLDVLYPEQWSPGALGEQAVICGIRSLNVVADPAGLRDKLLAFAQEGGVVLMQYITLAGKPEGEILPGLELGRQRVSDESQPVKLLKPEHPALNHPHRITEDDFKNWVQEIGLYAASSRFTDWTALIRCSDPGEEPLDGLLLVRPWGKGHLIYTGLSLFRQIPAGHPGAYKLLLNLIQIPPGS